MNVLVIKFEEVACVNDKEESNLIATKLDFQMNEMLNGVLNQEKEVTNSFIGVKFSRVATIVISA